MRTSLGFIRNAVSTALVFVLLLAQIILATGCPAPPSTDNRSNGVGEQSGGENENTTFSWDTQRRVPRWRLGSPIQWIRATSPDQAIAESKSTGKPILLYISRYDSELTKVIEESWLSPDGMSEKIAQNFVTWELDYWESPSAALDILSGHSAPALLVLVPDENEPDGFKTTYLYGHNRGGIQFNDTSGNPVTITDQDAFALFEELIQSAPDEEIVTTLQVEPPVADENLDPAAYVEEMFLSLQEKLERGEDLWPEEALWLTYRLGHVDETASMLSDVVLKWQSRINALGEGLVWMPDSVFVEGGGNNIDPERNLTALLVASAIGSDYPVNPYKLTDSLKFMLTTESGTYAGGLPSFLDIRGTHEGNTPYVDDATDLNGLDFIEGRLLNPVMGPRNIMWNNAKLMSRLLEIVMSSPEIMNMDTASGTKVSSFIYPLSRSMLSAIIENSGGIDSMTLEEKIYIVDLMNRVSQLNADSSVLYETTEIIESTYSENIDEFVKGDLLPLRTDQALVIFNYGWLMELEEVKETAREMASELVHYAGNFEYLDRLHAAYVYDVVHSTCVHTTVIAAPDDSLAKELLMVGLNKWDPGKISQILTPGIDDELIERKGYFDMGAPTAFVCIDSMCKPPTSTADGLAATLDEVYSELYESENE